MRKHMEAAEGVVAVAVAEAVELVGVPPDERAEVMRRLRVPILAAVMSFHAMTHRKVRRRLPEPSPN